MTLYKDAFTDSEQAWLRKMGLESEVMELTLHTHLIPKRTDEDTPEEAQAAIEAFKRVHESGQRLRRALILSSPDVSTETDRDRHMRLTGMVLQTTFIPTLISQIEKRIEKARL